MRDQKGESPVLSGDGAFCFKLLDRPNIRLVLALVATTMRSRSPTAGTSTAVRSHSAALWAHGSPSARRATTHTPCVVLKGMAAHSSRVILQRAACRGVHLRIPLKATATNFRPTIWSAYAAFRAASDDAAVSVTRVNFASTGSPPVPANRPAPANTAPPRIATPVEARAVPAVWIKAIVTPRKHIGGFLNRPALS